MFKKVFSLLLCIVMCVTCFSATAIEVGAVYEAKTLFAITSTPVKDGVLNYTINITANQMDIAGAIIYVKLSKNEKKLQKYIDKNPYAANLEDSMDL